MDLFTSEQNLRTLLSLKGPLSSTELTKLLAISQPTFARLVAKIGEELVRFGKARRTIYAIRRDVRSLGAKFPIFQISNEGSAEHLGDLVAIKPKGFFFYSKSEKITSKYYADIPYWLNDQRPSGFLGRLIARNRPELGYPNDIRLWSSDDCLHYWSTLGTDLIGDLVIGEIAYSRLNEREPSDSEKISLVKRYERCVNRVLDVGATGSSAGGEQPKFLTTEVTTELTTELATESNTKNRVLVKFSPLLDSEIARRRAELLVMEHFALETLNSHGIQAANSKLVFSQNRTYLELKRFDRLPNGGRRGLISLNTLDMEFCGVLGTWREIATELVAKRIINIETYNQILMRYYFGLCIANTDMHSWNLSFFCDGESILGLAPVYDMLPMAFAPVNEELPKYIFAKPSLLPNDRDLWQPVLSIATDFWKKVIEEETISPIIKACTEQWLIFLNGNKYTFFKRRA